MNLGTIVDSMPVGVAVPPLLAATPAMWLILVIGAAVSTVVMIVVSNVTKSWRSPRIPSATFPSPR